MEQASESLEELKNAHLQAHPRGSEGSGNLPFNNPATAGPSCTYI